MATASVLQSPHNLASMASRRAPLSNLPQATNSPLRQTTAKRTRVDTQPAFDELHAPPSKKQLLEWDRTGAHNRENVPPQPQTPQKKKAVSSLDARLAKNASQSQLVERDRAVRHVTGRDRVKEAIQENIRRERQRANESRQDDISRWQRYYEKKFPEFVFYFESVPDDVRRQCSRQVRELGAKEDKFFSKGVTHVITTRAIPTESTSAYDTQHMTSTEEVAHLNGTIDPALLERKAKAIDELAGAQRTKSALDAAISKKMSLGFSPEKSSNRNINAKGDVLLKARDLGIKIWQLEKLQRILRVMYADDEVIESAEQVTGRTGRPGKQTNLSQLIRNEERTQAGGRELGPLQGELIALNEPYIYVRCYNEKTKPLMVRQYQKVAKPEDGDWPQFRPVTQGKCPFVPEEARRRTTEPTEIVEKAKEKAEPKASRMQTTLDQQLKRPIKRSRDEMEREDRREKLSPYETTLQEQAETANPFDKGQSTEVRPCEPECEGRHDVEEQQQDDAFEYGDADATTDAPQISPPLMADVAKAGSRQDNPIFITHSRQTSFDLMAPPSALPRPNPRVGAPGGEPLASGLQKSGMTSAIRSQMISSTAAAPGAKAGTSKDLHSLQRRILERNSTGSGSTLGMSASNNTHSAANTGNSSKSGLVHSRGMLDIAGRGRSENPRAAKTKAVEKLTVHGRAAEQGGVGEDRRSAASRKLQDQDRQRTKSKREAKPGYCENCREKFDDFEQHTKSKKHRKFAMDKSNWLELDDLLSKLERPLKNGVQDSEDELMSSSSEDREYAARLRGERY